FKSIYSITKDKYKDFTLNHYLNTSGIKKGSLFSHKIKKDWEIFDESVLKIMEHLYQSTTEISKYVIEKIQKMLSEFEQITINELNDYFNFLKVNNVVAKYDFRYSTEINKKIKLYEQDSNRNAKNNCDQILKWYVNKLRNIINIYQNNKFDLELTKQIKNIFKISTRKIFPSVANFIKTNYRALKILFPIWIMSPNEVSINLPNEENIFDYGIFDEASQMFVENSIPSIFRCQNVCVAGDDKQLKPTNFFSTKLSYSDDEFEDEDFVANSLLDKAKESLWHEFNLKNHYRSKNANLIKFSNEFIYNNELETATINGNFEDWIEVYNVKGIWDDKRNSVEIDSILDYLEKNYTNQEYLNSVSYLLVTFNQSQKDELENRFASQLAIKHEYLRFAYENQLLKFRNIENVQGDEADFVIFSCTYAKNKENKFIQNFGPLMQDNGPNRLNVALTRAKEKMIVFKSFYGHEITNLTNNPNTEIFKQFILSMDNIKTENETQDLTQNWINQPLEFDSNFEQDVYYKLAEHIDKNRYTILTQFKVGSKRIDQVIFDLKQKKVILGIEVDGIKYHSGYKKVLEDIDRQYFLENRGYKIFRIKEYDWLSNEYEVINQILKTLQYC
ncbi:MAG: DUF559 domain-containing protein, partial [Ureaplasma sp.]|nr:DUF559 domain-containing protein [Ureaplasma sp.]